MSRGVKWPLSGVGLLVALIAVTGCSHYWIGEREAWRRDAEVACLNSGAVKETPQRVRISAINGPGMCGADFPLRVSALGDSAPLGYDDEPVRPPSAIPGATLPQHWPLAQPTAMAPALSSPSAPPLPAVGAPLPLTPPLAADANDDADFTPAPPAPYDAAQPSASYPPRSSSANTPPAAALPAVASVPPGPSPSLAVVPPLVAEGRVGVTAAAGPVEVRPPAVLACPIVAALDQWVAAAVQPAALRWFRQPVVEIKQISAYSCRGMNGNPNAHISEHAFGNALDIAEFLLADGHRVSVQYGWRGTPQEQGFLHDVQLAACAQFTTVLAPGANVYHYNHIHVDLMRHAGGRHICEPAAIPGEIVAERARARYAARHYGDPGVTGAIGPAPRSRRSSYSAVDDERLPPAVPGED